MLNSSLTSRVFRPLWVDRDDLSAGVTAAPGPRNYAEPDTEYTSNLFFPGIAGAVTISGGTYQKNGAGGFASTAGTALTTDSFEIRGTSSGLYSTSETPQVVEVTLTIGTTDFVFSITNMLDPALLNVLTDVDGNPITDVYGDSITHTP